MQSTPRDHYLFTEVQAAGPEKLQLLLVEGALKLSTSARQFWREGCHERALMALLQAEEILVHMLGVIDHDVGGDLAKRVLAVYEFIYRSLVNAAYRRDEKSLADAVRILEIERDTWRQVCDKLAADGSLASFHHAQQGVPPPIAGHMEMPCQSEGFSIEA